MSLEPDFKGALTALNRFGYGARGADSGDLQSAASDPRGFVLSDLERPSPASLVEPDLPDSTALLQQLYAYSEEQKEARDAAAAAAAAQAQSSAVQSSNVQSSTPQPSAPNVKPAVPNVIQEAYRRDALARFRRACSTQVGFVERLVAFWSNHFAVAVDKDPLVRISAGAFEREAIRPHVLGRFADMLRAVEQHPTMLNYLDNQSSIGPSSRAGLRSGRGLNENLAREIMELHVLGVDGGYTQTDVTSFAKILTGWSIAGPKSRGVEPGVFTFQAAAHEPGPLTLLDKTYADAGISQGEAALDDLARRPATAKFIATKLAVAFISDTPPASLIERVAAVFEKTNGDLRAVSRALIEADEAWRAPLSKMRTPYDYLIAANRMFGKIPDRPEPILGPMTLLGMPMWNPPQPNGFSELSSAWSAPEGMKLRLDVAAQLGRQAGNAPFNPNDLLGETLGAAASAATSETVSRAESKQQGFALLLMSPEVQRR